MALTHHSLATTRAVISRKKDVTAACAGIYASPEPFESGSELGRGEEEELERRRTVKLHTQTSSVRMEARMRDAHS
jgi:hypothetical protein